MTNFEHYLYSCCEHCMLELGSCADGGRHTQPCPFEYCEDGRTAA